MGSRAKQRSKKRDNARGNAGAVKHPVSQYIDVGIALHQQGKLEEASAQYHKALAADQKNADALHMLGVIAIQQGNFSSAIAMIEQSLIIAPSNFLAHYNMGFALQHLYHCDKAALCYQMALTLKPDHIDSLVNLGTMYMYLGDYTRAEASFRKAVAIAPKRIDVLNNLGLCLFEQGKTDTAKRYYEKVLALQSDNAEVYNNLACILQKQGEVENAVNYYRRAVALNEHYVSAYNNLAAAMDILGAVQDAHSVYHHVLRIKPECATTHTALAIHAWLAGSYDEAAKHIAFVNDYKSIEYSKKQNQYIAGYYQFIRQLLLFKEDHSELYVNSALKNGFPRYIIGDSHSLTYTHLNVGDVNLALPCISRLVFGCKAWHLANDAKNEYKTNFHSTLASIPQGEAVVFVFGEIDCRIDEGILPVAREQGLTIEEVVSPLVENYTQFVISACIERKLSPHFMNVPAPLMAHVKDSKDGKKEERKEDRQELTKVIALFNRSLKSCLSRATVNGKAPTLYDVYSLTNDKQGASTGQHHIDGVHLSPNILGCLKD